MSVFARGLASLENEPLPKIEWEETECLLCGNREWAPVVEAPDPAPGGLGLWFAVVQCQECGLCFTNPRPAADSIGLFYPEDYRPHRRPAWGPRKSLRSLIWKSDLGEADIPWHGRGRLLDFGCGNGKFLERMRGRGWDVTGLDVSPQVARQVCEETGVRVLVGELPRDELAPESFDVVTLWQSLEHVHQPRPVLREIHKLLAPGGRLVAAVPNIDSLPFRWFGSDWFALDLPRHLTHFTPMTLTLMLQRTGYRIHEVRMVRHSLWLRKSARLAGRHRRGPYWRRWLVAKPLARIAAWYSQVTQQSDCVLVTAEK